ncbi:MAG TPA: DUF2232 domain-containing protein [Stellaceae bacterium]|nr:DUF2232 domain-containing protein [Stellaceae bacterium]
MRRVGTASVAVACGGVGACLYLAVMLGTPGGLVLVYMAQLPLFIAGLWLGTGAAALAGVTAALLLLVASDLVGAAVFAAVNAVPVVLLVRQALLARRSTDGAVVWYPPGLLTAWLTALALAGIAAGFLLVGGPEGLQSALRGVVAEVLDRLARHPLPDRDLAAGLIVMVLPGVLVASWMIMLIANAVLAQGLLARFGANWRPSPDLAGLGLPLWVPMALGVAALAVVVGGSLRFVGINMLIALSVPFCLAGLAVLHAAARRMSHPQATLIGFYMLAAFFGWPFLAVAILGLLESGLGLRRRLASPGS